MSIRMIFPAGTALSFVSVLFGLYSGSCRYYDTGFQCGAAIEGRPNTVRLCNRANEVCVCETNSCAVRVPTDICASGLKYVEAPFALPSFAEQCVEKLTLPDWLIRQGDEIQLCIPPKTADMSRNDSDAHPMDLSEADQ
jgi:hypothetical protein